MDFSGPEFVIAIIALSTGGWLINTWIRAKHGYALENEWSGMTEPTSSAEAKRLEAENARLRERIELSEDRLAVLERIVTDKGYRLADEIAALRDLPSSDQGSGVPLASTDKPSTDKQGVS